MSFFGIDKFFRIFSIIKANGGMVKSFRKLYRYDELKMGTLVGEDKYGNKYFENNKHFYGRNRWVEYPERVGLEYDGSQIPAEWYGWMHYKTDVPPTVKAPPRHKWMIDHIENKSGTNEQYVPYSTTQPKIQSWQPPKRS